MGMFDWLRRRDGPPPPPEWTIERRGSALVVLDGRKEYSFHPERAQSVRIVPLGATPHGTSGRGGWQVAARVGNGDVPLARPFRDWQSALALAQRVCTEANLSLDETSQRLFSQAGPGSTGVVDAPR